MVTAKNYLYKHLRQAKQCSRGFYGCMAYIAKNKRSIKMWMELIKSDCMNMLLSGECGIWGEEKTRGGHPGGLDGVSVMCFSFKEPQAKRGLAR